MLKPDRIANLSKAWRCSMPIKSDCISGLALLRRQLPEALALLGLEGDERLREWQKALDQKLLPRLNPAFPLLAAICGGGSAGKSTLFNTLIGQAVSPTGGRAGLNRRVLAAVRPEHLQLTDFMDLVVRTFDGQPQPLKNPRELLSPGEPLYVSGSAAPAEVVLLDTPDIDTGAHGEYANRDLARRALEAADLFIYIFTNATYNNKDNTDFIARLLTSIGVRPCFLVYRVYSSFTESEVRQHALTVARNIYGPGYDNHLLGVLRADEDNAVAAGRGAMRLHLLGDPAVDLSACLARLDPPLLRERILGSTLADGVRQAEVYLEQIEIGRKALADYGAALREAQRRCVQQALSHFPTDRVVGRFAEIWMETDPTHIKVMRTTGRIVEWPYKQIMKTVSHLGTARKGTRRDDQEQRSPDKQLEIDLLTAANQLYQAALDERVEAGGRSAAAPAAVQSARDHLRARDWKATLNTILERKTMILSWSEQLEGELQALADDLRRRMSLLDQVRQTFAAALSVLPATAAITYVLSTGDPVGATGIKVKLTGIFGLKDLYALIAIPATAGVTNADRRQLELMLGPVAQTWLAHKLQAVETLFEAQITGGLLQAVESALQNSAALSAESAAALKSCKEAF
jgi:hypothetical protein